MEGQPCMFTIRSQLTRQEGPYVNARLKQPSNSFVAESRTYRIIPRERRVDSHCRRVR